MWCMWTRSQHDQQKRTRSPSGDAGRDAVPANYGWMTLVGAADVETNGCVRIRKSGIAERAPLFTKSGQTRCKFATAEIANRSISGASSITLQIFLTTLIDR